MRLSILIPALIVAGSALAQTPAPIPTPPSPGEMIANAIIAQRNVCMNDLARQSAMNDAVTQQITALQKDLAAAKDEIAKLKTPPAPAADPQPAK